VRTVHLASLEPTRNLVRQQAVLVR
jgi:hypothetical protein